MSAVLVPQEQDFPRWYQDVIAKSQLAENGPVRGTMVIRPWGYAIWERLAAAIDERIDGSRAPATCHCWSTSVVVARRARTDKETLELGALTTIPQMLGADQRELLAQATALRDARTRPAHSLDEAREMAADGARRRRPRRDRRPGSRP
jgi:hypothetical protein